MPCLRQCCTSSSESDGAISSLGRWPTRLASPSIERDEGVSLHSTAKTSFRRSRLSSSSASMSRCGLGARAFQRQRSTLSCSKASFAASRSCASVVIVLFLLKLNVLLNTKMHVLSKMASQGCFIPAIEPAPRKWNDRGGPTAETEAPYDDSIDLRITLSRAAYYLSMTELKDTSPIHLWQRGTTLWSNKLRQDWEQTR